jgi:hypothetical protein
MSVILVNPGTALLTPWICQARALSSAQTPTPNSAGLLERTPSWVVSLAAALVMIFFGGAAVASDLDSDGVPENLDNCPLIANPEQSDADQDGVGDACECGDVSGDGLVNSTDARLIQRCTGGDFECPALCDVTGEGICDLDDAQIVQGYVVGKLPKLELRCAQRPSAIPAP